MKFPNSLLALTLLGSVAASVIHNDETANARDIDLDFREARDTEQELYKRRGGGGRGGRGGGSSGGGRGGGSRPQTGRTDNGGGRSPGGSGPSRTFGGGAYYGGGAGIPYRPGSRSPSRGIAPLFFPVALLAFWPGLWLYPAYVYHYRDDDDDDDSEDNDDPLDDFSFTFYNSTTERNETLSVLCACDSTLVCGCDQNDNTDQYLAEIVGDGSYEDLDPVADVAEVNGTQTLLINGTLPNGTTLEEGLDAEGGAARMRILEAFGYWPAAAAVAAAVML